MIVADIEGDVMGGDGLTTHVARQPVMFLGETGFLIEFAFHAEDFFAEGHDVVGALARMGKLTRHLLELGLRRARLEHEHVDAGVDGRPVGVPVLFELFAALGGFEAPLDGQTVMTVVSDFALGATPAMA